jgi:diadenosine tetraphosphate (Ap4A) HIT family hydrolase
MVYALLGYVGYVSKEERATGDQPIWEIEDTATQTVVPARRLGGETVKIQHRQSAHLLTEWKEKAHYESFCQAQKIYRYWQDQEMDALTYATTSTTPFEWKLIATPPTGWAKWHQFKVLFSIIAGGFTVSITSVRTLVDTIANAIAVHDLFKTHREKGKERDRTTLTDAFCNQRVLNRQWVYKGKYVSLLINYRPLVSDQKHFLIVTNAHKENFQDLSWEEYQEICRIRSAILNRWPKYEAHLLCKSGKRAGQEVPHLHEHVILTPNTASIWKGYIRVLTHIFFAPIINILWSGMSKQEQKATAYVFAQKLQKLRDSLPTNKGQQFRPSSTRAPFDESYAFEEKKR